MSCSCDQGQGHGHHHGHESASRILTASLGASGLLLAAGLGLGVAGIVPATVHTATFMAAAVAGGWMLLRPAWESLRRLRPGMSLLMVLACIGAAVIGEWAEAATVVFLFGVAEWLEGWSERRAHRAMRALLELTPSTATVKRGDSFLEVPVDDVKVGELVAVKGGSRIPLDGEVVAGMSSVDEAPITGESFPVEKMPGDSVFAGTVNHDGTLEVRVAKPAGDTTLARIIRLVEEAEEQKAPTERFVEAFARRYTPAVALMALLVLVVPPLLGAGDWTTWLYRACVLLIIACPCALVISTPVSIVAGLTALARRGVLVKGGAHLENLARLRALAMDKTGTITEGRPRVRAVTALGSTRESEIIRLAASLDEQSTHPLARAVVEHARERGVSLARAAAFRRHGGRGAEGAIDGHDYFVGNHRFTHELGVCSRDIEHQLEAMEAHGQSVVVVGHKPHDNCLGEALGIVAIGDAVRRGAREAIADLHAAGVKHIVMLSGDNRRTAETVASTVGIDEVRAELLPEDKLQVVREMRGRFGAVAMVGDGVNDAPAMAAATLGIAMGAAGTDVAIETSDVALMNDELGKIALAVRLGRRTLGIIRFNIAFALALKALFLVLAVAGYTSLWLAILADTGATLLVIANSLRLLQGR